MTGSRIFQGSGQENRLAQQAGDHGIYGGAAAGLFQDLEILL